MYSKTDNTQPITKKKTTNVWVLAFDPTTNKRVDFVCCPPGIAIAHAEVFKMSGFKTQTLSVDEIDALIEAESQN